MKTIDWSKPNANVTRLETAFGPKNLAEYLPAWEEIPDEFKRSANAFCEATSKWFFEGLPEGTLIPIDGIDERKAQMHLWAVLRSFEPQHEHKEAGVAFLMSKWFKEPKL